MEKNLLKYHFISFCCLFVLVASIATAIERVTTFQEAVAKGKETGEGYVVLVYGKDWDRFSSAYKKRVWDQKETFAQLNPKTAVCEIYLTENPTKEEEEAEKKRKEGFKERINSIPSVYMFNAKGECYMSMYGKDQLPNGAKELAEKMGKYQKLGKKRDEILAEAAKEEGVKKAGLLAKSAEVPEIRHNTGWLVGEIKKADPEDKGNYAKSIGFSAWGLHKYFDTKKYEYKDALAAIDGMLKEPYYTPIQKQEIMGVRGALLRRNKASKETLKKNYLAMKKLDPTSLYAKVADKAIEEYVKK